MNSHIIPSSVILAMPRLPLTSPRIQVNSSSMVGLIARVSSGQIHRVCDWDDENEKVLLYSESSGGSYRFMDTASVAAALQITDFGQSLVGRTIVRETGDGIVKLGKVTDFDDSKNEHVVHWSGGGIECVNLNAPLTHLECAFNDVLMAERGLMIGDELRHLNLRVLLGE